MDIRAVENLAELARIELSEEEKKSLLKDMEGILGYIKQIKEVKVDEVAPAQDLINVWREDLPASGGPEKSREFSPELIKEQFPDSQDGFLKVKKIL
ncbi:MAG: Aspartyl/glutamyl-tRNA(Asn/Gln) amidotransferase subunit C [Candidatus Nomurabacteria bacterium GW2011_GWF2_43_8]|uniref:Aspartyl/glutamyl-tRNA(Asn/Gln) amidotransferase subunit C n=3 Tax=Candidatus Nomuraibacteriota TaxID=1752729 RepID=A0A0G1HYW4_9BACT|nr:MAG: Aspartyl/glutamyl-tRNA(Asn/Gln) amidotransferase subunit C [Candidatus Nomurabacteria bacterium GW2011_GWA2_43_15]KKT19607.1 MAG: Aspartyl/glutamyl-tRNA(Asn/Gln) amidotransferase subunit C [Candidatus Nomurabacteria bacterium GW2011_GWB1_43_7]KKT24832.1 MAG: Aspartyl/glutamyl-tRNA(Asn/Gln) amidotransferase subunit C [Candidatus Nomurabacteria bacterium GW2011_GWF2_43_8]